MFSNRKLRVGKSPRCEFLRNSDPNSQRKGQLVTKEPVAKVRVLERSEAEVPGIDLWFDKKIRRLNTEKKGQHLGHFKSDDMLFALYKNGCIEAYQPSLDTYFDDNVLHVGQLKDDLIISCVYIHGDKKDYYVKRFRLDELTLGKREEFISQSAGSKLLILSFNPEPCVEVSFKKGKRGTPKMKPFTLEMSSHQKGLKPSVIN